ncbi:DUF1846 domain-containing protein [Candidatus Latescibacterota bacterium]
MDDKIGFDNEKYLEEQKSAILERVKSTNSRLYLEFGGKIIFDYHAARVLPGFNPNTKIKLIQQLKDQAEVILCIYAGDIARNKIRADFGISYDSDVLKTIDDLSEWGIKIRAIVITRFENQPSSIIFKNKLERRNLKVYTHKYTKGYPTDIDMVVSEEGYGANEYIEIQKPIGIVIGPGPGSGKLATCLSQLYHDHKRGIHSYYAKYETFPIWNLPINHEVNVAYEAATADLKDIVLIDHFHLEAYNKKVVNYNRDIEAFPLLKRILEKITDSPIVYKSPTDMGVNRAGFSIINDEMVREASSQEIIRRYFRYACEYVMGFAEKDTVQKIELIMKNLNIKIENRKVVLPARQAAIEAQKKEKGREGIYCGAAIELKDGSIVTGNNSSLMHATSSLILNTVKQLAGIPKQIDLLPLSTLESLSYFKKDILKGKMISLDLEETLISLITSTSLNPTAKVAIEKLKDLNGCEVHLTHLPTPGDAAGLRKLGVNLTSDPVFPSKDLYVN